MTRRSCHTLHEIPELHDGGPWAITGDNGLVLVSEKVAAVDAAKLAAVRGDRDG